jgi:hypothetical protein
VVFKNIVIPGPSPLSPDGVDPIRPLGTAGLGQSANRYTVRRAGHPEVMGFFDKLMELTGGTFRLEVPTCWPTTRTASYW